MSRTNVCGRVFHTSEGGVPRSEVTAVLQFNTLCMDKLYYFANRAIMLIKMHAEEFNDVSLFSDEDANG